MPSSVRQLEVIDADTGAPSTVTAGAFTLQELIGTIPFAYQVRLGDHLTKKYRVAHKHANVQSTLSLYSRHLTDGSFPPIIRNSLKEPRLQFAKEFLQTTNGSSAPETFQAEVLAARKSVLRAAIKQKEAELTLLSTLILPSVNDWQQCCRLVAKTMAENNGGQVVEKVDKNGMPIVSFTGLPEEAIAEYTSVIGACKTYTFRVLAIARSAIDRAELQKLSKLKLKETTDVEMTDIGAREPAMRDVIREELKAFKKEMSQTQSQSLVAKRQSDSLIESNREAKKSKRSDPEKLWRENETEWWEQEEEREGQEVSIDAYLSQCSRDWRPWAPESFPNVYCSIGQRCRNKLNVAFLREWEIDTMRSSRPGVFKFKDIQLPEDIEYMLAVNHKYILHPKAQDHDVHNAKERFKRAVRIRYQFRNEPSNPEYIPKFHVANPDWNPQKASKAIELGLDKAMEVMDQQIGQALSSVALKAPRQRNLNWTRVQQFLTENSLLTKLTDKNLGLAVFPKEWYVKAIQEMLTDEATYEVVFTANEEKLRDKLNRKLSRWKLPKSMEKYVRHKTELRMPQFHAIPKVHKSPWTLRPIVPSHSWVTSRVSEVIDYLCRPILEKLPWVVNSTKQVINNLSQVDGSSEDIWICTGDVVAFYTNIDARQCARTVAGAWQNYCSESKISAKTIMEMMQFVMNNNFFQFQDHLYTQKNGLAMGTACAPLIANIYAAYFERQQQVRTQKGVLLFNRYIDDILMIFQGSEKDLTEFIANFKLGSLTVKWDYSQEKKEFLDVEIMRVRDHRGWHLATRLFKKQMNRFLYIPWSSAHPTHVKRAFVKAELIRFAIVSSEDKYFADACIQFYGNLRRRGYPREELENWIKQVSYDKRALILASTKEEREAPLMLSGQYNPVWEYINVGDVLRAARREWSQEKDFPELLEQPLIRSLSRYTSLFDLLSTWNKTILHPDTQSSENIGVPLSLRVHERGRCP